MVLVYAQGVEVADGFCNVRYSYRYAQRRGKLDDKHRSCPTHPTFELELKLDLELVWHR